jgi:CO/xanthine dehydrogenase Mo-binding subunit
MQSYSVVGKGLLRVDGRVKATGEARYTFDLVLPGMLYGRILRSPYPHAKILNIDTRKAEALLGVKAVITGKDIGAVRFGCIDTPRYPADQSPLAIDKVRYIGEEVAAVAAIDKDTADEALQLIEVDYEEIPAVFDPEEAMREGAPRIHEIIIPTTTTAWEDFGVSRKARPYEVVNNISNTALIEYGDVEQGFKESDYVREDRFVIPSNAHVSMEPRGALANFDSSGKLEFWSTHMGYEHPRYWLAKILGMPISKVRVLKAYVGGAFGDSCWTYPFQFLAAFLSRKTGKPVKITLSREEIFTVTRLDHRMIIEGKIGVKRDGTLTAYQAKVIHDVGAYRGSSPTTLYLFHAFHDAIYHTPNLKYEAMGVYTNKLVTGPRRGNGIQQHSFAFESQLDMIAEHLGIDPLEIRLKNFRKQGDVLSNGDKLDSYGLPECLLKAAESISWNEKRGKERNVALGIGTSAMFNGAPNYPFGSAAIVKVNPDGIVTLFTGGTDFGQGHETVMSQIAAEELGVRLEDIILVSGDSEACPYDIGNWLSAGVYTSGQAVKRAAADAKQQILSYAAEALGIKLDDLDIKDGYIFLKTNLDVKLTSFSDISKYGIQKHNGDSILGKGFAKCVPEVEFWGGSYKGTASLSRGRGRFTDAYSYAAAIAEVAVDKETGKVKINEITVAADSGFDINPLNVQGQLESQAVMGMGDVLFEEIIFEKGRVLNSTLTDYRIPGALDIPKITTISVQTNEPKGPFGAKEVGEGARAAVWAAVSNAICNAIGTRIYSLPMTPEKILEAIKTKKN